LATPAFAVNGFFLNGYGAKSIGVAGVGVAMPQDRMAAAVNPAGMALVEPGYDVSIRLMHPQRSAKIDCTGIGACDRDVADRSNREFFVVPHFGYSKTLSERTTLGVTMYVNGGMNTSYSRALYNETAARVAGGRPGDPGFPAYDKLGVDFSQSILAPSLAYRYSDRLILGIAPLFAVHRFAATGLASFEFLSADPTSVSNRGTEYALGAGVRVGAILVLADGLRVGAQYTSRIFTERYTEYNGLFADNGRLDGPPHYTVGFAWDIDPRLTIGFDFHQIQFGTIDAVGNPGPTAAEIAGVISNDRRLGGSNGIGFGWSNQSVYKAGFIFKPHERIKLRGGWNHGTAQIPEEEILPNLILPSIVEHHLHAGLSFEVRKGREVSIAYMHGFGNSMRDPQTDFLGVPARIWAAGDTLDLSYNAAF
jgi:long-chain fatty acid transport protein